ncbi:hypothetical protein D9M71_82230 [compost metagenome]
MQPSLPEVSRHATRRFRHQRDCAGHRHGGGIADFTGDEMRLHLLAHPSGGAVQQDAAAEAKCRCLKVVDLLLPFAKGGAGAGFEDIRLARTRRPAEPGPLCEAARHVGDLKQRQGSAMPASQRQLMAEGAQLPVQLGGIPVLARIDDEEDAKLPFPVWPVRQDTLDHVRQALDFPQTQIAALRGRPQCEVIDLGSPEQSMLAIATDQHHRLLESRRRQRHLAAQRESPALPRGTPPRAAPGQDGNQRDEQCGTPALPSAQRKGERQRQEKRSAPQPESTRQLHAHRPPVTAHPASAR